MTVPRKTRTPMKTAEMRGMAAPFDQADVGQLRAPKRNSTRNTMESVRKIVPSAVQTAVIAIPNRINRSLIGTNAFGTTFLAPINASCNFSPCAIKLESKYMANASTSNSTSHLTVFDDGLHGSPVPDDTRLMLLLLNVRPMKTTPEKMEFTFTSASSALTCKVDSTTSDPSGDFDTPSMVGLYGSGLYCMKSSLNERSSSKDYF
eukprot:c25083_g3_i3 orf=68-682(-)